MNNVSSRWNSVHAKLLRTIIFSFSMGILISGAILLAVGNAVLRTHMIEGLNVSGKIFADRAVASLIFLDQHSARENMSVAADLEHLDKLCLYDREGTLFAAYTGRLLSGDCNKYAPSELRPRMESVQRSIGIYIPVVDGANMLGHLYMEANTQALSRSQWLFSMVLFAALTISLLVAYLLGNKLVSRSLLSLDALYKTSLVIADNPLSQERAKKISDDEVGRVVDVFNDVLDSFSRENNALTYSEKRFRLLAENSPIGVFLKKGYSDYEYTNSRWSDITNIESSNASTFISYIDAEDRARYQRLLDRAFRTDESQIIEFSFIGPGGIERELMEYVTPVTNDENESHYIGSLLDVTELKDAQDELVKLAFYDPLTHLPNRRYFRDHLENALLKASAEGRKIAIYMTDLDEFKKVNDSLGHDVGDQLLINIAQRLHLTLGDGDVASRMGGDEFMVLVEGADDEGRLEQFSKRALAALSATASADSQSIQVSGSIGISIYPDDARSSEELIRYADIALYHAKELGGGSVSYYSKELDQKIKSRIRLEQKLRIAIRENNLDVFIQPQYVAGTREVFWGEALVRWFDEDDGFIPPEIFVPLAEETGLIYEIGDFVLNRVLKLLSQEQEALAALGISGISVNLSAKQFFSTDFSGVIARKFDEYNVLPERVEFELTETTVMDDIDKAIIVMEALRDLGCRLSIDDFGTGYSSLAYLKRFPITSLKIDKSFIQDIPVDQNDVEISCAIIALAHSLGLSVVAEGVETELQAVWLASRECEYLQGYFLDRPMSIETLLARAKSEMASGRSAIDDPLPSDGR